MTCFHRIGGGRLKRFAARALNRSVCVVMPEKGMRYEI